MTLTIELPEEMAEALRQSGEDPNVFAVTAVAERLQRSQVENDAPEQARLRALWGRYVGVLDGTPGPEPGHAWSNVEAACDPL